MLQGTLQPERPQDSRFGFAMAALPDLNQDGFSDVAVGAPLEDGHRGALYLYHGTQNGIRPHPTQVGSAGVKHSVVVGAFHPRRCISEGQPGPLVNSRLARTTL